MSLRRLIYYWTEAWHLGIFEISIFSMQIMLISLIKCSCVFIDIDRTHRQIVNLAVIAIIIVAVNCIFCCVCFSYSSFLTGYIDREEGESMRLAHCYRFCYCCRYHYCYFFDCNCYSYCYCYWLLLTGHIERRRAEVFQYYNIVIDFVIAI